MKCEEPVQGVVYYRVFDARTREEKTLIVKAGGKLDRMIQEQLKCRNCENRYFKDCPRCFQETAVGCGHGDICYECQTIDGVPPIRPAGS